MAGATQLQKTFEAAAHTGADILIHTLRIDPYFNSTLESEMDFRAFHEEILTINSQDPASVQKAGAFFQSPRTMIKGVYNLKAPFADAQMPADELPATVQDAIRSNILKRELKFVSLFAKLLLLSDAHREAAKARIDLPLHP